MKLRAACVCGHRFGRIITRGNQDCVYCKSCKRYQYNAPRTETGRAKRTVSTTHKNLKDSRKVQVRIRASGRCELCGALPLAGDSVHAAHVLSVKDGLRLGLTERELNHESNLVGALRLV